MCKFHTGYHGTSDIEHGFCACVVDNLLAKARGLSLHTGAQTVLYLSDMGGNNENDRVASAESVLFHLKIKPIRTYSNLK